MRTSKWLLYGVGGVALAFSLPAPGSIAREGVRTIPLAAVAPADNRNIADTRPAAIEPGRSTAQPNRGELTVAVDRAKVIKLPEKTQTVIIGNPAVADISIQKNGVVVLTGKSFGVTNFIALDSSGGMIGESMVSVTAPTDATLTVQRGLERQTYSCTPVCQPSVALGDAGGYFAETKGQVDQHSAFVGSR
ncbi:pilus assembly protein N-terminal domain-containing protein [Enterovirga aerilata]|uniref:Pilus assembly protein n=1 Tax=Enterovirga aerilata TaxID=2730920 RepID=A0A849IFM0_9HYPH|nr:pilus assembly protein N-terminal domain-containing protein [Enterovirga sp. DB1703]NNM74940.1 pilus assembly protein [Enterovirga sp. DB1703]